MLGRGGGLGGGLGDNRLDCVCTIEAFAAVAATLTVGDEIMRRNSVYLSVLMAFREALDRRICKATFKSQYMSAIESARGIPLG